MLLGKELIFIMAEEKHGNYAALVLAAGFRVLWQSRSFAKASRRTYSLNFNSSVIFSREFGPTFSVFIRPDITALVAWALNTNNLLTYLLSVLMLL